MYGHYDSEHPIIVGLSGPAGSGKTSTAVGIIEQMGTWSDSKDVNWDHIYHAMPLYEFVSIKTKTIGENSQDRQLHLIHDLVRDICRSTIPYDDMVELVYDIYAMPLDPDGKPRTFLQNLGVMLREKNVNCFVDYAHAKSYLRFRDCQAFSGDDSKEKPFIMLISDVRFMNEAQKIKSHPNGFLIRYDADPSELQDRLYKRDKKLMTAEQNNHESEAVGRSPEFLSLVDLQLDTTDMNELDQIEATISFIKKAIGVTQEVSV
jgi:hypothetical protein